MLSFTVFGIAKPKGSTRPFMVKSKKTGMMVPIVTESNTGTKSWQQLVAEGANHAMHTAPDDHGRMLIDCGVRLDLVFHLPRPKKFMKRGLEPAHLTKPDLDKLTRAVQDALRGIAYVDDQQVTEIGARKRYAAIGDAPHVEVTIARARVVQPAAEPLPLLAG